MTEIFSHTPCRQLSQMFFAVFFFHCSEYVLVMAIHGKNSASLKSLLISRNYILAMICSFVEYFIEFYFFPAMKEHWLISNTGLALVIVGEIIRILAIITAGRSFTHLIKRYHEDHHALITHGIYKFVRHPGYCGFFIWSVGTQVMLCNPLATVAFALVVWRFFQERIPYEEFFLRQFFGLDYEEYARQTSSGIPFIK
ncbi:protein-S-isoprenylcysteine O-methyltransferase [Castilleja foliolosa]|uniref:Protein-S-isoprenylcysteine O-methyltransferase n=1 Tax=Castilleja foliolosa TaxID=1961234 RepID=A0ABD3EIP8_9LAMI